MGPQEMGPGQRELMEAKEQIVRLRDEAARAKGEGRFDESQRLWDEAQNIETKLMREREVRRMAENLGSDEAEGGDGASASRCRPSRMAATMRPESCGKRPSRLERDCRGRA